MEVYTIGFAKKPASEFFGALRSSGIKQVLDVRLHNTSQLAGFTKREDLAFFLAELCGAGGRPAANPKLGALPCKLQNH